MPSRILCLSNGHGEDAIALRILSALQQLSPARSSTSGLKLAALPIVGEGHAYRKAGIEIIGPTQTLPSGGFLYMEGKQLARDIQGGLVQLTRSQWRAIRDWSAGGEGAQLILAVGDIVPLAFAWRSGLPYAFVGTAKSEYYLRDEAGELPRDSWWSDRLQRSTGCIYLPWERWLLSRPRCLGLFPRDRITAVNLQQRGLRAYDHGNPMMDDLPAADQHRIFLQREPIHITLIPGSRPPEAYSNLCQILQVARELILHSSISLTFSVAIAPGLDLEALSAVLLNAGWTSQAEGRYEFSRPPVELALKPGEFAQCAYTADLAIAMAGTATEQFVGLGKPAFTLAGAGPQFTPAFAEAQTRLLGPSVRLLASTEQAPAQLQALLEQPLLRSQIRENGELRMGQPGAAPRIAQTLLEMLLNLG
jgi:uncharacterized protein (TIGR03492 family)